MFVGYDAMSERIRTYELIVKQEVHTFRLRKMNLKDRALVSVDELYCVALTGVWRAIRLADKGIWKEPETRDKGCGFVVMAIRAELRDWLRFVGRRLNRQCVNLKFREGLFGDVVPFPDRLQGLGQGACVRVAVGKRSEA